MVRSIEDLTDEIRTRSSKLHFQDAMRAYSAGAYRAATIVLWTAVMHDLTDKLRPHRATRRKLPRRSRQRRSAHGPDRKPACRR